MGPQELPGAPRSRQEHPEAARCVDGRMGVRKGWQQGVKNDVEKERENKGGVSIVNCMHLRLFIFHTIFHTIFYTIFHRLRLQSVKNHVGPNPKREKHESVKNPNP